MDEAAIETLRSTPIPPLLAAMDSVQTLTELMRMLGGFARRR